MSQVPDIVTHIRTIAREHGWAIGTHGSLVRDIDLVAVPWTKEATSWRTLHTALIERIPLWDAEGTRLGLARGPFGRIKTLILQPGCEKASEHPKGHWNPPAIDLSWMDLREALGSKDNSALSTPWKTFNELPDKDDCDIWIYYKKDDLISLHDPSHNWTTEYRTKHIENGDMWTYLVKPPKP